MGSVADCLNAHSVRPEDSRLLLGALLAKHWVEKNGDRFITDQPKAEIDMVRMEFPIVEYGKKTDMSQPLLLVVDDEAGVRQSLQMVFNKIYRVLEASSADEAMQKVTEERPDAVLLDIMMPGADGLGVLKQIKSIHPDCQVIMLTGINTARRHLRPRELAPSIM